VSIATAPAKKQQTFLECRGAMSKAEQKHRKCPGVGGRVPHWTHWVLPGFKFHLSWPQTLSAMRKLLKLQKRLQEQTQVTPQAHHFFTFFQPNKMKPFAMMFVYYKSTKTPKIM